MKRVGNIWNDFISIDNIEYCIDKASRKKTNRKEVKIILKNIPRYAEEIQNILIEGWTPQKYREKTIIDKGKERNLQISPFFPDRIIHTMIDKQLQEIFVKTFINETYQCIIGRGTHKAIKKTEGYVRNNFSSHVLKLDIKKYYPSVDNDIMISKIKRKVKDKKFLDVLKSLIYSSRGLTLGNCTSQILGNIFLSDLDHSMKSYVKGYLRYADDIIIFDSKKECQKYFKIVQEYMKYNKLELNKNSQLFNLNKRTLEFLGFRFFRDCTRPSKKFLIKDYKDKSLPSIFGWIKDYNCTIFLIKTFYKYIYIKKHFSHKVLYSKIRSYNENNTC